MALAYGEGMNASLVASAENVFQDASAPLPLRVAAATATNQMIRRVCGIVAARRWPAGLLKAGRGLFTDYEYANLAAAIAVYWPEQAAAAAAAVPADKFAEAKSRITV